MVKTMQIVNQQKVKANKYYRIHKDKSLAFISSVLYVLEIRIKENLKYNNVYWFGLESFFFITFYMFCIQRLCWI